MTINHFEPVRATDVFGVSRELPLNYVTREQVDGEFVNSLTREKHVIIYGSSKQGKTSLRKQHLRPEEFIVITCSNKWNLAQLHTAILKSSGYTVEGSTTKTETGSSKITAKAGAKIGIFGKGVDASVEGARDSGHTEATVTTPLELDPADVNEVIGALEYIGFARWIVLEDFHYLPEETQRDFSVALKAFHESSDLVFIIVGVWLQRNRLAQFNGDLAGRVVTVDADRWSQEELLEVVTLGERHLNVRFDPEFRTALLDGCYDSIYVVQESCLKACISSGIDQRREGEPCRVTGDANRIMREVVDSQSGRYSEFISNFSGGFGETELEMYRWLLLPVLTATMDQLEEGLPYRWIRKRLAEVHPKTLNAASVSQALKSVQSLQVKQGITPLVLDYDSALRRLNVVDRSFLVWLRHQDRQDLLEELGFDEETLALWAASTISLEFEMGATDTESEGA